MINFNLDIFIYILYFGFLIIYLFSSKPRIIKINDDFTNLNKINVDCKGNKYKYICENKEEDVKN